MARIGIVADNSTLGLGGGIDVYTQQLVEALAAHGQACEYVVLTTIDNAAWLDCEWPSHIQFAKLHTVEPQLSIGSRVMRRLRRAAGLPVSLHHGDSYLARQVDALELDLVHFPRTTIHLQTLTTPCVLTFFDMQQEYFPEFFTPFELAERARTYRSSVDKASHIIVPSKHTRCTLMEKYDVSEEKMTILPVGLIESFRRTSLDDVQRVKTKYGLPGEFIFYPANPWQHKNHARLIAALRIYHEWHGDCPWLVVSGRLHNEHRDVMSLAIAAGVENRVIDLMFVDMDDLPALYSAAQLLVFPSLFEGFGIPLVEAMACGCPIAAANATTIPEITNGAALLFDPLNSEQIAEVIYQALHNADLREAMIARGAAQLSRFAWDEIVSQLITVYESVVREYHVVHGERRVNGRNVLSGFD